MKITDNNHYNVTNNAFQILFSSSNLMLVLDSYIAIYLYLSIATTVGVRILKIGSYKRLKCG